MLKRLRLAIAVSLILPGVARAQQAPATPAQTVAPPVSTPAPAAQTGAPVSTNTVCGQPVPAPRALPPTDIGPVVYQLVPCFEAQDNVSLVDIQTYLYYIQTKSSRPSEGLWIRYNDEAEKSLIDDFKRLWGTNFLDNPILAEAKRAVVKYASIAGGAGLVLGLVLGLLLGFLLGRRKE